jgi:hypothetical protein
MICESNHLTIRKRLQYWISQFVLIFYFISLPAVLYLELTSRLIAAEAAQQSADLPEITPAEDPSTSATLLLVEDTSKKTIAYSGVIFFPEGTTVIAYSLYVTFTVISFILLALVEKSNLVDAKGTKLTDEQIKEFNEQSARDK